MFLLIKLKFYFCAKLINMNSKEIFPESQRTNPFRNQIGMNGCSTIILTKYLKCLEALKEAEQ